jgi:hypothetical protein
MRKCNVANVMCQIYENQRSNLILSQPQSLRQQQGEIPDTDGMLISGVRSSWIIYTIHRGQVADPAQSL